LFDEVALFIRPIFRGFQKKCGRQTEVSSVELDPRRG
jgi:hypothetical protein